MGWVRPYKTAFTKDPGAVEPVSLDDIKESIKGLEDIDDFDNELLKKGVAAREKLERLAGGVSFVSGSAVIYVDATESSFSLSQLPYAYDPSVVDNLIVNKISPGDADDLQTLNTDYYFIGSELSFPYSGTYRVDYDIVITEVPEAVKQAILLEVESMWEKARDVSKQLHEMAVDTIKPFGHVWL